MRVEQVLFPAGAMGTTIDGRITGRGSVLYAFGAEVGRVMIVNLTSNLNATYFNLCAPGTGPGDQALVIGKLLPQMNSFTGTLFVSGQ